MKPERETDERLDAAWLDVPDPLGAPAMSRSRPRRVPEDPSPTRDQMRTRRLLALGGAVVWAAVVLSFFGLREDLADDAAVVMTGATLSLVLFVGLLWSSLRGARRGLGPSISWARALAVGSPAAFIVWALVSFRREGFAPLGPVSEAAACFGVALLVVVPTTVLAMMAVRRSFAAGAGWRGALVGAACGFVAALVLTLHCTSPFGGHVALAHGLPIVIAGAMGAFFGVRIARA